MPKQQAFIKYIFKLHSKRLADSNWDLCLPLETAIDNGTDIVGISDSQALRFIDQLNGTDSFERTKKIKKEISGLRRKPASKENTKKLKKAYLDLYNAQFQKDYVCVVMDSMKDYDRCNKGFFINGIRFKRFLGTNGGIKKSTIIYISENIYPALKEKLDCGRDKAIPLVPAKLEAYQALICSGSIPVSMPKGIIVVPDCKTSFTTDAIYIDDSNSGIPLDNGIEATEPTMVSKGNHPVTFTVSDGMGFMLPELSTRWNKELCQDPDAVGHVAAVNVRGLPWTKGMLFTFDFIRFCGEIADNYLVEDVWGQMRDVRKAEAILTASMLKLWKCYGSWEEYEAEFTSHGYTFAVAKASPDALEEAHTTNYQFLQSYELTDGDVEKLTKPTVDNIKDIMGLDYRKSILYLKGSNIDASSVLYPDASIAEALMVEPKLINDSFVRGTIKEAIKNRIKRAKTGVLDVRGNFAIIGGDLYALAQSMCGLEVTGLLKEGEIYHKFWFDRDVSEVCCFRAPMTSHNNIRKQHIACTKEMADWYRYVDTCVLFNAWDSTAEALNGCDFDGDLCFTTNDEVLLRNTRKLPTIFCVQRRAPETIVTEKDIIKSNKLSFGDAIGSTTNVITSQICALSKFGKGSDEYKTLYYRVMCGQMYQQACIDKAKGIISKPMPRYWHSYKGLRADPADNKEIAERKRFLKSISANKKPYFFIYNYDSLYSRYNKYIKNANTSALREFGISLRELAAKENKSAEEEAFMSHYNAMLPVDFSNCTVNRICWYIEDNIDIDSITKSSTYSDGDIKRLLKSKYRDYTDRQYYSTRPLLEKEYGLYRRNMKELIAQLNGECVHGADRAQIIADFNHSFITKTVCICPDDPMRCDILIDIAYDTKASKKFVWETCGRQIIKNLLSRRGNIVEYPVRCYPDEQPDFIYRGEGYVMVFRDITDMIKQLEGSIDE